MGDSASSLKAGLLLDPQFVLHLFQRVALGLRIDKEHDEELQNHHRREEDERVPAEYFASIGNVPEMMAFMIQCEELPRLWPLARTRVGKTSLI